MIRESLITVLLASLPGASAFAQCPDLEIVSLLGPDQTVSRHSIDRDVIAVPESNGSVRVHRRDPETGDWPLEQWLLIDENTDFSVAVRGDLLVAGDLSIEQAYVFRFNPASDQWEQEALLDPPNVATDSGWSGSGLTARIHNDVIVIGLLENIDTSYPPELAGRVYIYRRNAGTGAWEEEQVIYNPLGIEGNSLFSASFDVHGDTLIISAPREDGTCPLDPACVNGGAVYIYRHDVALGQWLLEQKLVPLGADEAMLFGSSVAIEDNRIVVFSGLPGTTYANGAIVYEFDGRSWQETARLQVGVAVPPPCYLFVGHQQVDLSGDMVVVGGGEVDLCWPHQIGVFVHDAASDTWTLVEKIAEPNGDDVFVPIGMSDGVLLGSVHTLGMSNSRIKLFELGRPFADCNQDLIRDSCQLGANDLNDNLIPDDCERANGDLDLDGTVNISDLLLVLSSWGPCSAECPGDTNQDDQVNITDLLAVLMNWQTQSAR